MYQGVRARVALLEAEAAAGAEAAAALRAQLAAAIGRHGAAMADAERLRQVRAAPALGAGMASTQFTCHITAAVPNMMLIQRP